MLSSFFSVKEQLTLLISNSKEMKEMKNKNRKMGQFFPQVQNI